uniref:Uncharacterized protein n=1 Tax=Arundo donax TaxID=35708 RepID=A0A0A9AXS5_ARUDO
MDATPSKISPISWITASMMNRLSHAMAPLKSSPNAASRPQKPQWSAPYVITNGVSSSLVNHSARFVTGATQNGDSWSCTICRRLLPPAPPPPLSLKSRVETGVRQ